MKLTKSMSIGRRPFICEIDAIEVIDRYLQASKKALKGNPDVDEITHDLEVALADHLHDIVGELVVDAASAQKAVELMGEVVDDESSKAEDASEQKTQTSSRSFEDRFKEVFKTKLTKDSQRKIIEGVCAGIARTLDIDPVWVRLVFVALAFITGGSWVAVYIIMALIMDSDTSKKQRTAQEVIEDIKSSKFVNHDLSPYSRFIVRVIRSAWAVVRYLAILTTVIVLFLCAVAWSLLLFSVLTQGDIVRLILGTPKAVDYIALAGLGALCIVPLISGLRALIMWKSERNKKVEFALTMVTILAFVVTSGAGASIMPRVNDHLLSTVPQTDKVYVRREGDTLHDLCVNAFGGCLPKMSTTTGVSLGSKTCAIGRTQLYVPQTESYWTDRGWVKKSVEFDYPVVDTDLYCAKVTEIVTRYGLSQVAFEDVMANSTATYLNASGAEVGRQEVNFNYDWNGAPTGQRAFQDYGYQAPTDGTKAVWKLNYLVAPGTQVVSADTPANPL